MLTIPADFDPEADIPESDSDASGDDDQEDKDAGARDHYAPVGKSKLRKPKEVALGPQYSGSRVTRDAIEGDEDEDDDPFARGFDDEDSEEEQDVDSEGDDEELEDGTDATDMSDEEDDEDDVPTTTTSPSSAPSATATADCRAIGEQILGEIPDDPDEEDEPVQKRQMHHALHNRNLEKRGKKKGWACAGLAGVGWNLESFGYPEYGKNKVS